MLNHFLKNTFTQAHSQKGQGLLEFGLLLVLVVAVVIGSLAMLGPGIGGQYQTILDNLGFGESAQRVTYLTIIDDFLERINDYYDENGRWPRSWGDYAYTDIGLDPADWQDSVEGIRWGPHGADVGLGTDPGDDYMIYVSDLDGNEMRLYDSWNIWCVASSSKCYYHRVEPENEIDITTLRLVERE